MVKHHQLAGTAFLPQILIIHHHQVIAHSRTLMLNRKADQDSRSAGQKEKGGQPTHSALMPIAQFVLFLYPSQGCYSITFHRCFVQDFTSTLPLTMIRLSFSKMTGDFDFLQISVKNKKSEALKNDKTLFLPCFKPEKCVQNVFKLLGKAGVEFDTISGL